MVGMLGHLVQTATLTEPCLPHPVLTRKCQWRGGFLHPRMHTCRTEKSVADEAVSGRIAGGLGAGECEFECCHGCDGCWWLVVLRCRW